MAESSPRMLDLALKARLENDAFEALATWCENKQCRIDFVNWLSGGKSGAGLAEVVILDNDRGSRKAVLKYCPPRQDGRSQDFRAYQEALDSDSRFARSHIVKLDPEISDPIPGGGGGLFLVMAYRARGRLGYDTLAALLDRSIIGDACGVIISHVLEQWNKAPQHESGGIDAYAYLQEVLGGRNEKGAPLVSIIEELEKSNPSMYCTDSGDTLPSVFAACVSGERLKGVRLAGIRGNAHGDLHEGNILIPAATDKPLSVRELKNFLLIDLSSFAKNRLLAVDPVNLMLSIISQQLPEMTGKARSRIADLVLDPEGSESGGVPIELVQVIRVIHKASAEFFDVRNFYAEWHTENLAAIASCAILFIGWVDRGDDRRWFAVLAARAISLLGGASSVIVDDLAERRSRGSERKSNSAPRGRRYRKVSMLPSASPIAANNEKTCTDLADELIVEAANLSDLLSPADAAAEVIMLQVILEELSATLDSVQKISELHQSNLPISCATSINTATMQVGQVLNVITRMKDKGTDYLSLRELSSSVLSLRDATQYVDRNCAGGPIDS